MQACYLNRQKYFPGLIGYGSTECLLFSRHGSNGFAPPRDKGVWPLKWNQIQLVERAFAIPESR